MLAYEVPTLFDSVATALAPLARVSLALACLGPAAAGASGAQPAPAGATAGGPGPSDARAAADAVKKRHGPAEAARIERGVEQVLRLWRPEDGDAGAYRRFVEEEFLPSGASLDAAFDRLEYAMERIDGYLTSMGRDLRRAVDLEIGPLLPVDRRLAAFQPGAHVVEDLFQTKVAFVVLLNFPITTLQQRLAEGGVWPRRQWAEARLAQRFSRRVPAEVAQRITAAYVEAESYINDYNIHMHHLLTHDGRRLFPEKLRLISHWNLRDELKARYSDPDGLEKQRMILKVMERIVRQEIPAAAIDNPLLDWTPESNAVAVSRVKDAEAPEGRTADPRPDREPDARYLRWRAVFEAERLADPFYPDEPTFVDRRFNVGREIPEAEVQALFESVLQSPLGARVARLIETRLGRKLEPFDIWYAGFKPRGRYAEAELDAMTRKRYPTAEAYAADMPRLFAQLGFAPEQVSLLADHIEVDASRGAGHAMGAGRRDDKAHLRTRVEKGGMDYKGYNIAVHEMGHNVEQVFSLNRIDHTLLAGVPNNAFTEALAFVFQARDLELLGLQDTGGGPDPQKALEEFWATREIAGVGLVDTEAWRWLYAHPDSTPAQFREAVVQIAQRIWNQHYAGLLGGRDTPLLGIYSHMVAYGLYTPDYPLGHLIAFQVEEHFEKAKGFGAEFERVCRIGNLTPDAWMRQAVGGPLSAEPLLRAAAATLESVR